MATHLRLLHCQLSRLRGWQARVQPWQRPHQLHQALPHPGLVGNQQVREGLREFSPQSSSFSKVCSLAKEQEHEGLRVQPKSTRTGAVSIEQCAVCGGQGMHGRRGRPANHGSKLGSGLCLWPGLVMAAGVGEGGRGSRTWPPGTCSPIESLTFAVGVRSVPGVVGPGCEGAGGAQAPPSAGSCARNSDTAAYVRHAAVSSAAACARLAPPLLVVAAALCSAVAPLPLLLPPPLADCTPAARLAACALTRAASLQQRTMLVGGIAHQLHAHTPAHPSPRVMCGRPPCQVALHTRDWEGFV